MYNIINCTDKRTIYNCNFNLLHRNMIHPDRVLSDTHDLLYVLEGGWEIIQDGQTHALKKDDMVVLHAGHRHFGKISCLPDTLIMFLHISRHNQDCTTSVLSKEIMWKDSIVISDINHCQKNDVIKKLFKNIIYNYYSERPNIDLKLSPMVLELFYELSVSLSEAAFPAVDDEVVNDILYKLRTSSQTAYTVQQLAQEAYLSPGALANRFKKATGMTIYHYQLETRLAMAHSLLMSEENITLKELAKLYGFYDEYHFGRLFKKKYGISPIAFRKKHNAFSKKEANECGDADSSPTDFGHTICW